MQGSVKLVIFKAESGNGFLCQTQSLNSSGELLEASSHVLY